MLNVQFKQLKENTATPSYQTPYAAGMDLSAAIDEPITINPGAKSILIPTGFAAYIGDPNYAYLILPRSGMGHKRGLILGNGTGVIDADYQGEVMISACVRPGHDPVTIQPGDRIAQIVFVPVARAAFTVVDQFSDTSERGTGGFNSTGT